MPVLEKVKQFVKRKRAVPKLDTAIKGIELWFDTPLGKQLLSEEQALLDNELSCLFGYHLMQLSINRKRTLFDASRISHCFATGTGLTGDDQGSGVVSLHSQFDALPFEDESLDVTILHHVLEFSDNPHQVLKEASRVTIARGYIIVLGFNPFSFMGLCKPIAQLFSRSPIWKRNGLRRGRVIDWLQLVDCNTVKTHEALYNAPWQNQTYIESSMSFNKLLKRWRMPFGNFYCLVARKDRTCLTPIKAEWFRHASVNVGPKTAVSARSAARLAVVKNVVKGVEELK